MSLLDEFVEVVQGAEPRVDVDVIADVIAEISHRGGIDGGQPYGVYTERDIRPSAQIPQPGSNPVEIGNAVTVGVLKSPRVDLIKDGRFPPRRLGVLGHQRER